MTYLKWKWDGTRHRFEIPKITIGSSGGGLSKVVVEGFPVILCSSYPFMDSPVFLFLSLTNSLAQLRVLIRSEWSSRRKRWGLKRNTTTPGCSTSSVLWSSAYWNSSSPPPCPSAIPPPPRRPGSLLRFCSRQLTSLRRHSVSCFWWFLSPSCSSGRWPSPSAWFWRRGLFSLSCSSTLPGSCPICRS